MDEDIDLEKLVNKEHENRNIINQFDDGKTVIGGQGLKRRLSPSHNNQFKTSDHSGSPRPPFNMSPGRSQTPSVNLLKIRKSS